MTRRILALQVLLTSLLLVSVCIPLGLEAARHDRDLLTQRVIAVSDAYTAKVKWRWTATGVAGIPSEDEDKENTAQSDENDLLPDDDLAYYGADRVLRQASGDPVPLSASQVHVACESQLVLPASAATGNRVVVATPVVGAGGLIGVLVIARSDRATQDQITQRWLRLSGAAVLVCLLALGLSVLLARWVNLPLRRLERAAAALGDGKLSTRAQGVGGPRQVRQLAASFDAMAARIEELVGGQRAFLADVSHQIRTPLTAMRLRLELLAQDLAEDPVAAAEVGGTLGEVHRLSRMVDGLLAMAKAQARDGRAARVPVRVDTVVADRVAFWGPVAVAHGARITTEGGAASGLLTPGHLEQVLDNLLSNALEAISPGGRVSVAVVPPDPSQPARRVRVTVADNGPGMAPEARAAAFERFRPSTKQEQARAVRADRRGHGLGLAVVHALVVADGGEVALDTAESGGLLVVLDLPAAPTPTVPPDSAPEAGHGLAAHGGHQVRPTN